MKIRVCFVCHGNICRSPTAEAIMLSLVEQSGLEDHILVESAGTSDEHSGEDADPRAQACAVERGLSLDSLARQFEEEDFERFDYVIAMDAENRDELLALAPDAEAQEHIFLLRAFDPAVRSERDVPDPYFGGESGFDDVWDMCEAACQGLLDHLIDRHQIP